MCTPGCPAGTVKATDEKSSVGPHPEGRDTAAFLPVIGAQMKMGISVEVTHDAVMKSSIQRWNRVRIFDPLPTQSLSVLKRILDNEHVSK